MAAMFNSEVTPTSESIHTSPTVLLNLENTEVAVRSSLLAYVQVEIYVIAHVLPVNGGHLWFTSHTDVGEYPHMSRRAAGPQKWGTRRKFSDITFESRHPTYIRSDGRHFVFLWAWLGLFWYLRHQIVYACGFHNRGPIGENHMEKFQSVSEIQGVQLLPPPWLLT